jgi:hypothetical protein
VIRNTLAGMLSARQVPLAGLDRVRAQVIKLGLLLKVAALVGSGSAQRGADTA